MKPQVTVEVLIDAPVEKVWQYWTLPEHIVKWCFVSDDWCAPKAENDVRTGGNFKTRMEARDGSVGFDLEGNYTAVEENKRMEYTLIGDDERKVSVEFKEENGGCRVIEIFDPEDTNPLEMQQNGWQAILNNFKKYIEALKG